MQTKTSLRGVKERNIIHCWLGGSIVALTVFLFGFTIIPVLIAEASAAQDVSSTITWSAIDLTLDPDVDATDGAADPDVEQALPTHGNVEFGDIVPTVRNSSTNDYGTLKVEKKTIGVTTHGKYYTVFLSMNDTDPNLNFTYNGETNTNIKIEPTSGTWDSPVAISANNKSNWGYMVPETTITKSNGDASAFSALTQEGVAATFNNKLDTALYKSDGSAYSTSIWAAVPVKSTPQQIWKNIATGNNNFSSRDEFDIYYAVNVDVDTLAGTYKNNVVYTALASAQSLDQVSTNLIGTLRYGGYSNEQTIYFDLAQTSTDIVTEDKITIKLVPHSAMVAASFDPKNLSAETKATALTCTKVSNSFQTVAATQNGQAGTTSSIECIIPNGTIADNSSTTKGDGAYDFWLNISGYDYNYVSKVENGTEPAFIFAGLQSVDDDGGPYITEMQEMTAGICQNTNKWGNTLGSFAKLYAPDGTTDITDTLAENFWENYSEDGIGSFALKDTRDGKRYVVRRLADDNCWMSQNLNLDLYTGMTFTSDDTDLNSRTSWTLADAPNSNDETILTGRAGMEWIPNSGSTSRAWQTAHGVETVTLKKYTYDGTNWNPEIVAQCTGGTAQTPCFATATTLGYHKPDGTAVDNTLAASEGYTRSDGGGSAVRGYNAGAYYGSIRYQVKQLNTTTNTARTARNVGLNNITDTDGTQTCDFSFDINGLVGTTACVVETSGDTMITQLLNEASYYGLNGLGNANSEEMVVTKITKDHLGNDIDFMNNISSATRLDFTATYENFVVWPRISHAGDYRWSADSHDGAHVIDLGPMYFNFSVNESGNGFSVSSTWYPKVICGDIGTVSGNLKLADDSLGFITCLDATETTEHGENIALASTRLDGNLYNLYAAVAGSPMTDRTTYVNTFDDSICPKGWKLPGDSEQFDTDSNLSTYYSLFNTNHGITTAESITNDNNDALLHAFPLSFVRSGYYTEYHGSIYYRGNRGFYLTSHTNNRFNNRMLFFEPTNIMPRRAYTQGQGSAIRCVARD